MRYSKRLLLHAPLIVSFALLLSPSGYGRTPRTVATPQDAAAAAAKINGFLQQSGYNYKKVDDTVWFIKRQGKNISDMQIIVATGEDYLVVGVVVAAKNNLRITADSMFKMLKLAHDVDYVKVGIDNDDDLFVRSEVKTKTLDLQEFKNTVENIFAAADKAYAEIRPYLNAP